MKAILTILFYIITWTVLGQDFEGKISYHNSYKSKVSALTSEQLTSMVGTTQEYYIKGGNYKSITNGTFSDWQLFINKDNKLYTKLLKKDTVYWQDVSVFYDSIISFKINRSVVKICGYNCDELILTCKKSIQKFYYNSKLAVTAS